MLIRYVTRGESAVIPTSATTSDLVEFVRRWFRLLAAGRDEDAAAQLDEPNSYGQRWSGPAIRLALEEAFPEGCRFRVQYPEGLRVTEPRDATGKAHDSVVELKDRGGYSVWCSVPLNGEWS